MGLTNPNGEAKLLFDVKSTIDGDLVVLANSRVQVLPGLTPVAHEASHLLGGSDPIAGLDPSQIAGTVVMDDDPRLSDDRSPITHGARHSSLGIDPVTLAESQITNLVTHLAAKEATANKNVASGYAGLDGSSKLTGSQQTYGSIANTACQGNDSRLSDARTPTAHATTHKSGGTDAIKLDEFAVPTDVTTLNVATSQHGLCPKAPNLGGQSLLDTGLWGYDPLFARVSGSNATTTGQALTNITGLTLALLANATYEFEAILSANVSADTTGLEVGVQFSAAGAAVEAIYWGSSTNAADRSGRISALNTATAALLTTSAQDGVVVIRGILTNGANAGNLTIQHLKVTSGTSTIRINSFLRAKRIA